MAEAYLNGEQADINNSSSPVDAPDYVDLTEHDDFQEASSSERSQNNSSNDESLSIVYENIQPQFEEDADPALYVVSQLLQEARECSGQVSKRVKMGSKSVNVSVSVRKTTYDVTTNIDSPDIIMLKATSAKPVEPPRTSKVECGICLDGVEEILTSERKLLATVCGHIFCCRCYTTFMTTSRKSCPKCRKLLTKKQVHPLYI